MSETYYYGKGKVYLSKRDPATGATSDERWIGDVSKLTVTLNVDKWKHKESYSGQNATATSGTSGKDATMDMILHEISADNLAMVLYGKTVSTSAGTVTGESLGTDAAVGDTFSLANIGIGATGLSVKVAASAVTEGTDYDIDRTFGRGTWLTAQTGAITADYSYNAVDQVAMFNDAAPSLALRYDGYNKANSDLPVVVDLYNIATDPLKELNLISSGDDAEGMEVSGEIMIDSTKPATGDLGQFGRVRVGKAAA